MDRKPLRESSMYSVTIIICKQRQLLRLNHFELITQNEAQNIQELTLDMLVNFMASESTPYSTHHQLILIHCSFRIFKPYEGFCVFMKLNIIGDREIKSCLNKHTLYYYMYGICYNLYFNVCFQLICIQVYTV